jgi:hypothetical protein
MPIVLITLTLGIVIGYWLCRMQLRGKFLLADEQMPLPGPWCTPDEAPLSQQWKLPPHQSPPTEPPTLIHTPRCPEGYSAKQVLGYKHFGTLNSPQYPGGFEQWRKDHDDCA